MSIVGVIQAWPNLVKNQWEPYQVIQMNPDITEKLDCCL